jgi:hypothetical protein
MSSAGAMPQPETRPPTAAPGRAPNLTGHHDLLRVLLALTLLSGLIDAVCYLGPRPAVTVIACRYSRAGPFLDQR